MQCERSVRQYRKDWFVAPEKPVRAMTAILIMNAHQRRSGDATSKIERHKPAEHPDRGVELAKVLSSSPLHMRTMASAQRTVRQHH
jgi:hypothetical protein